RLAMVMDLSYSLNLLNSADLALAKMQALLDDKIKGIDAQKKANDASGGSAGQVAGEAEQWRKEAEQQAAADHKQAADFASLASDVSKVSESVQRFRADVPALLAAIDGRDKGRSANASAEYDRRLALLPGLA